ncbi:MAG TPA: K+/H+ antiporter subunit F [Halothiobacillus sp.]|nr:MAG: K+/H+ antiporter subunit F [Halothiobacillus sp. 20-54-6]HQT43228.1 K+/H+ antiporter subunit F [Halothiobacillus sp.]
MIHTAALIGLIMVGLASLLTLYRLVRGPTLPDRILALDTLTINTIALIVLFGIWIGTSVNFEAALLMAVLGFISTVILSKYLLRGRIIELKNTPKEHD